MYEIKDAYLIKWKSKDNQEQQEVRQSKEEADNLKTFLEKQGVKDVDIRKVMVM